MDNDIAQCERQRIVKFLDAVYYASTHGASGLFERAIKAVEDNDMLDPARIADPADGYEAGAKRVADLG